jgi:sec-independent protein translocase protein TatB
MREAEMADLKKQVDEMTGAAQDLTKFDPLGDLSKDLETTFEDKPKEASATPAVTATVTPETASPETASPEAAAASLPEPGDVSNPQPTAAAAATEAEIAVAPEAPQPKSGSGA